MCYAFLFSIPLGTKKFIVSFSTPFSNFYTSEYTAAFLYGSDILFLLLLLVLILNVPRGGLREAIREGKLPALFLGLFVILAGISLFFSTYLAFGAYAFLRLIGAVGAGVLVWWLFRSGIVTVRGIMTALALSAVLQSVVAFLQFVSQKSVGLWFLGETVALGPETAGVAAITVDGVQFLRAYGTLPHANILAGFLAIGFVALGYLFFRSENMRTRALVFSGVVAVELGLLLTFSRSGWIVATAAIIGVVALGLLRSEYRKKAYELGFGVLLSLVVLIGVLQFLVFPRAQLSADDGPVQDRWRYNEMGVSLIAARPLGVGIGNQLFYSYDRGIFDAYGLPARGQWQPIHNLYLLMASEIGIAGLIVFLIFILTLFIENCPDFVADSRRGRRKLNIENSTVALMLFTLLLFGLFDHFLWDLQAGRLMLWVVIGMMLGAGNALAKNA